ncbi:MAG: [LysW]-aminoadipate/[LysW]-glutamate kinase, partial [Nitrososphaeria archaeon]|nr:[LysW]-aminoadipate/[LysW]-glutamate kinase [Nitrososphaeria archaeon]
MSRVLVVKAGGRALEQNLDGILRSLAERAAKGVEIVFVHGGGDVVSRYERLMGMEPKFVMSPQGIRSRYTDEKELEVYVMVMAGKLNKEIVSRLQSMGVKAVGLTGADGGILRAERKDKIVVVDDRRRKRVMPGGYTGSIKEVNTRLLEDLLAQGYTVVISPIALGSKCELLNVDADQAAASIARALKAEKLLILTDVEGVILDGRAVESIKAGEAEGLQPRLGAGMNRKVMMCAKA